MKRKVDIATNKKFELLKLFENVTTEEEISTQVHDNLVKLKASVVIVSAGKNAILNCFDNVEFENNTRINKKNLPKGKIQRMNKSNVENEMVFVWKKEEEEAPLVTVLAGLYPPRIDQAYTDRITVDDKGTLR